MKKPTSVKIVEALGWAYVALAALAGLRMVYDVVRLGCGASAVVESVFFLLVILAMPLGMVLSLRNGRRVWFLCSHWAAVGLFLFVAIFIALVMFPTVWIVAGTAFILLVVPIVLLLRHESSLWCRHVSNGKDPGGGGCLISALALLWIVLLVLMSSDVSCRIKAAVAEASHEHACAAEQDANAADFTIENALDAFWRHARAEGGEKQCDDGFGSDDEDESDDGEYTHDGFFPSKKKEKPSVEGVLSVDYDGDRRLWRVEHWSLLKIGNLVKRDETSTNISAVYTNLVVASAVDSSGKVVELSSRYVSEPPDNGLPFKSLVSFCKAKGISLATVSGLRSGGSESKTETGVVRYGGTTLCVTKEDVMKAEKDAFLAAISNADRVVVRKGGYNCCNKDVDNDNVVLAITNAADIAAFNRMFQLKDKGNSGCFCCGFPGVDWWRDGKRVVLTGIQHGKAIRWRGFSLGDRLFTDESARELGTWLSRHSLDEAAAKR